ncbi:hypothetical protein Poli38472_000427 [Pythium oligandrum]|uniref:Uncharacterized protein n=1 Tax=Pythium oligandrum TaxID=41045 RepID=A0A8K1CC41_PYTOL|nr:hypothetical protein Poli38472_000427 [Pythium oligandrum]|eukprot:TMW60385.1 hypothetical protein Poli38472_000427 [Pythium oligandrum]
MDVTWRDLELIDGTGRVPALAEALLRDELRDERLAVVLLRGSRETETHRRQVIAELLQQAPRQATTSTSSGVTLLACVSYIEEDYRLLILDAGDALNPAIDSALCVLSSLVMSMYEGGRDAEVDALPTFRAFQDMLLTLQRDFSAVEVYEMLPSMLTVDASSERSLKASSSSRSLAVGGASVLELARLKTLGTRTALDIVSMDAASFFGPIAQVKKVFDAELTSELLLQLLFSISRDALDGQEPDLGGAWDEYVEGKSKTVADDALATYVDCIHGSVRESPPMEMDAFQKLHDELYVLAMDVFHNGARLKAPSRRAVRSKLKADLKRWYEDELVVLRENSRSYCEALRASLWQELSAPLLANETSHDVFRAMLEAIQRFDEAYNDRARGPEKAEVLRSFYRHETIEVFQRLEHRVHQQMTDAHLKDLREQLERDFDVKKDALVEHFKQEEAQLRVCMAREMEMMQKLHQAKHARVKMDENEGKRLREEVAELKRTNETLESQQVALEHTKEEAILENKILQNKVFELEDAVHQAMSSRAELVDTLAATIKSAEDKETQLFDRIAELELDVKEKASRLEGELRDLTMQQRKTNEEKEELQKKLNEFFLKVTALPDAIQQHLFCANEDQALQGKIGFADALSSFMSD